MATTVNPRTTANRYGILTTFHIEKSQTFIRCFEEKVLMMFKINRVHLTYLETINPIL